MMSTQLTKLTVKADQTDRRRVRNLIRKLRREIPQDVRRAADERICRTFQHLEPFQNADHVAGFLAFDGEADPLQLMTAAFEAGKNVYVPVIIGRKLPLMFSPWSPLAPLAPNEFGISEPISSEPKSKSSFAKSDPPSDPTSADLIQPARVTSQGQLDEIHESWKYPHEIDFVIHPLVAFDCHCRRIGVGGGYYDRSFPPVKPNDVPSNPDQASTLRPGPQLFGFAYEIQLVGSIEINPWDRVLDGVITERKLYRSFR